MCARRGPTASLASVSRPLEKPEFIVLKERLTEGEEYIKELEKLRAYGRHEIRDRRTRPRGPRR